MSGKRDKVLVALTWTSVISFTVALACLSYLSPLAYCWVMGITGSAVILVGGCITAGMISSDGGIFSWYFSWKLMEGVFQLVGLIFLSLIKASSSSSD